MDQVTINIIQVNNIVQIQPMPLVEEVQINVTEVLGSNGLSAYEIAVKDGFVGTESDWLSSINNTTSFVTDEIPAGLLNGSNATFTTAYNFIPGTEEVFINGIKQKILFDYNIISSNSIQLYFSPSSSETITINYKKS